MEKGECAKLFEKKFVQNAQNLKKGSFYFVKNVHNYKIMCYTYVT